MLRNGYFLPYDDINDVFDDFDDYDNDNKNHDENIFFYFISFKYLIKCSYVFVFGPGNNCQYDVKSNFCHSYYFGDKKNTENYKLHLMALIFSHLTCVKCVKHDSSMMFL